MTYRVASTPLAGPARSGAVVHVKPPVKLIFYPGEQTVGTTLLGHIYVVGGAGEVYEACGGPAKNAKDGRHTADPTPKGKYRLGPKHHHVTTNWPLSCIAWGASLRQVGTEFEYQDEKGRWHLASGPDGKVTKVGILELERTYKRPATKAERASLADEIREYFFIHKGGVRVGPLDKWYHNDFGEWAWQLPGTACYIHTTPPDELNWIKKRQNIPLENSHGCVHVHPKDRDEMMQKGYLVKGAYFEVKGYSEKGPP